jgi:hypothetical protein
VYSKGVLPVGNAVLLSVQQGCAACWQCGTAECTAGVCCLWAVRYSTGVLPVGSPVHFGYGFLKMYRTNLILPVLSNLLFVTDEQNYCIQN